MKNGQYVGVDEKYIPEEEKYVDNSVNSEIKGLVNDGIKTAKDYVSDKDNQEKMKKTGKKGLNILKGFGIGYLVFWGFVILLFIVIFVILLCNVFKINKDFDNELDDKVFMDILNNFIDKNNNIIDKNNNIIDNYNNISDNIMDDYNNMMDDFNVKKFNSDLEEYKGTKDGSKVKNLLDNVVTKIKKNSDHLITVTYGNLSLTNAEDIILLKKQFDDSTRYEIYFEYDSNNFINKVIIADY